MEKCGDGEPTGSIMEGLWGNAMQYCLVPLIIGSLVLKNCLEIFKDTDSQRFYKHPRIHL